MMASPLKRQNPYHIKLKNNLKEIKLGIIGYPLSHSLSSVMHRAAINQLALNGDYVPLETSPEDLPGRVKYLKTNDFNGFNVTIPHKVSIMPFLDNIDPFAQRVGAVNTVVIEENNRLSGYNTDVYGFVQAIPEHIRNNLRGKQAAVLGSGGAARAVIAGLEDMEVKKTVVFARNQEKALQITSNFMLLTEKIDLSGFSMVVNTTPLGMQGKHKGVSPLSKYSIDTLPAGAFVYDIVYRPSQTKLLQLAQQRGLLTLNGLDMLVLQGARGFYLWTGIEPPVDIMRKSLGVQEETAC